MDRETIIYCENLMKIYKTSDAEVVALQGLNLTVKRGEMIAIIGSSGSGKSTLLNIIGALDEPNAGKIIVDEMDLSKLSPKDKITYKRQTVGFVWQNQQRNLIPYLSALENIELVMKIRGNHDREKAMQLLEYVGLSNKIHSKLKQLSGGEQQRVAIAIGICSSPKILLTDEPTGSVDNKTASDIIDTFRYLQEKLQLTIIIVTHDTKLAAKVDRVVLIRDGRISSEYHKKIRDEKGCEREQELGKESHDEYIVLDSTGKLQIPLEYIERAGLKEHDKVKIALIDGNITILPVK